MGGLCKHKETGKTGVVLGVLKKGITTAKIQWESSGETTDVLLTQLEHIEPIPFSISKLSGITLDLLKYISRLSGITNEIEMPQYDLTDEEKLLLPDKKPKPVVFKRSYCSPEPQVCPKRVLTKTVESLSNEMVSNIMGEVIKMSSDNTINQDVEVNEPDEEQRNQRELKIQLMLKLLNIENDSLRLAFIQCAALKTLQLLLTTNEFSQHFLIPCVFDKDEDVEKTDAIKWIMLHVVNKSIQQCKSKSIVSVAEIERAESILQLNYVKCKSEEYLNKTSEKSLAKCPVNSTLQQQENEFKIPAACMLRPSSSQFGMSLGLSDTSTANCKYFYSAPRFTVRLSRYN